MTEMQPPTSPAKLWLPYVFDIVAPFAAYLVVHAAGKPAVWALTAGGVMAAGSTAVNTIRKKGLDAIGGLVVVEIVASILMQVLLRDPRLLLIRPSFYTGLAAIYLMISAFGPKPLSYVGSRPMAAAGGPKRVAAFERAWERSAEFRRTHRAVTFGIGTALAADSILRVVVVYSFPLERSAWLSNVPHLTAVVLIILVSAMAGRRFARLVDEQM
jgi:hypothetical protein